MRDPLAEYRKKRDFGATPEPDPAAPIARKGDVFIVHRHEGVLKSLSVPRGFSYATSEKRLAVRTEDHPIEYEHFHGRIPKGQYGAGTMTIWDRGTYELVKIPTWEEALEKGELKIVLHGKRLRGEDSPRTSPSGLSHGPAQSTIQPCNWLASCSQPRSR